MSNTHIIFTECPLEGDRMMLKPVVSRIACCDKCHLEYAFSSAESVNAAVVW
jgi:hypothetical protein